MPTTTSAIRAIQDLYATLSASAFPNGIKPPLYLTEAPTQVAVTPPASPGTAQRIPYLLLIDRGEVPTTVGHDWVWADQMSGTIWEGAHTLEAYYESLGDCDAAILAAMWGGQDYRNHAGLAFCTLNLALPYYSLANNCVPGRMVRSYAGFNLNNNRVHKTAVEFSRRVYQDPNK